MTQRARYWEQWIRRWEQSGLTQATFCRRHGLKPMNFGWWKRRLASRTRSTRHGQATPQAKSSTEFVEVQMQGRSVAAYEIVLAHGRVIRLSEDFDPARVSRLVAAVESAC